MHRKSLFVALCLFGFSLHAAEPPIVFMRDSDPAMKRAFEKAKSSLDEFLRVSQRPSPDNVGFAVKVGIKEGRDTEYFWITDFGVNGEKFSGKIGNTPQMVQGLKLDQVYEFGRDQIVDWMYMDKPRRKMIGNFTYCALLTKEPPAQAAAARKRFNLDCDD